MTKNTITLESLRRLVKEELLAALDEGVLEQSSPAAQAIAKGIAAYLTSDAAHAALKGVEIGDPDQVVSDVIKLTQAQVFRVPLEKLVDSVAGRAAPKISPPRGKPEQSDERPTIVPPPPKAK